jgi:PAS domain S-box-containing protein
MTPSDREDGLDSDAGKSVSGKSPSRSVLRSTSPREIDSSSSPRRFWRGPLVAFGILLLIIGIPGYLIIEAEIGDARRDTRKELAAIADMKTGQISAWVGERRADAEVLFDNALLGAKAWTWIEGRGGDAVHGELLSAASSLQRHYDYAAVAFIDRDGKARVIAPPEASLPDYSRSKAFQAALQSNAVLFEDMHFSGDPAPAESSSVRLGFWIPIRSSGSEDAPAPGVWLLLIDPARYLYPLVQNWPEPSETAESLLVRREGNDIVFLNELRHRQNTALTLRLPIEGIRTLPAAAAIKGQEGVASGIDYRGAPVLAATRRIPGTPWSLVAKIDRSEVYAPLRERGWTFGLIVFGLVFLGTLGWGLGERSREEKALRTRLAQERESLAEKEALLVSLRESEEHYRSLFENMLDGFAYCQMLYDGERPLDFVYLDVNGAFETLTGLRNVVGKKVTEVIPGIRDSSPDLFDIYGRVALTGRPERFETYVDGLKIWFSVSVYSPKKEHFVAVFDVITERKRAEEKISRYADRLKTLNTLGRILTSSLDLNLVYDAFVEELSRLARIDRTAVVLLNETRDAWKIERQWTRGKPALLEGQWRKLRGSVFENIAWSLRPFLENEIGEKGEWPETEALRREGIRSRALLPLVLKGEMIGALTLGSYAPWAYAEEDLEALGQLADQLTIAVHNADLFVKVRKYAAELEDRVRERTAQLESANKELEAFSYSVSHDLRSPLRGIDGWSLALAEDCGPSLNARGKEFLGRVRSEIQRMGRLIDDLLQLSRVSRDEIHNETVDLTDAAEAIALRLRDAHPGRNVEFVVHPGLTARGDPRLLEIVLVNLLDNAWKFTGTRLAARVEFGRNGEDDKPVFFIRDNGVGFDMAYADKLFTAFQRLHKTSQFPGTGIGLAIVQRIVARHGGHVWAKAKPGEGAAFFFALPEK